MDKRRKILLGMGAGALWALAVVGGTQAMNMAFIPAPLAVPGALAVPGLVMLAMIARLAQRRFFDDSIIDGEQFAPGTSAWIDQRVLSNTTEQMVLAAVIWPFVALIMGGALVLVMGFAFAIARVAFWVGYHVSAPMRAFGFAATFYPSILAALWALIVWLT